MRNPIVAMLSLMVAPWFLILILVVLLLAGCQTMPSPVDRPCGVIRDSLETVRATTANGQRRLDIHHARGKAAGCWGRK